MIVLGLLVSVYAIFACFANGCLSPKKIRVQSQQIDIPSNYIIFQTEKGGKLYNLFEIPFLDMSFDVTANFEDSGVELKNPETKEFFSLNFAEYTQKMYEDYFDLLSKDNYYIKKINNCNLAIKNDKEGQEFLSIYIYKLGILYHYLGSTSEADNLVKQLCKGDRSEFCVNR